jgi:hypothetical protein
MEVFVEAVTGDRFALHTADTATHGLNLLRSVWTSGLSAMCNGQKAKIQLSTNKYTGKK